MSDINNDNDSSGDSSLDSSSSDSNVSESKVKLVTTCLKLELPEHLAAYYERRELIRESEPMTCDSVLTEKVMSNYIVVKKILSNLCWQDKLLCKHVSTTWHSAVNSLAREQQASVDYIYTSPKSSKSIMKLKKSGEFHNEPMAVMVFTNIEGFHTTNPCKDVNLCTPVHPVNSHALIDAIHQQVAAPKNCMLTVVATYLVYMPLPQSICSAHTITRFDTTLRMWPFISGMYIPIIPDVEFHVLNIRQNRNMIDLKKDFFDEIDRLAQNRIFKGVLVYVTEKYVFESVEEIIFLNYLKDVQPDIPYALGGCIVEETIYNPSEINDLIGRLNKRDDYVSDNLISIGLFTVSKNADNSNEKNNFDMFSLVIESAEWAKPQIQKYINDFGKKVPRFEHSVALKLSCVGRDQKHAQEQDFFRAAFPNTPIIGCYGNGELGLNHPPCEPRQFTPHPMKRHRRDPGQQGIMYSYSTVFVYIGWGKITSPGTYSGN